MLQLARLEEGGIAEVPILDLGAVVRSVAAQFKPVADTRSIHVNVQGPLNLFIRLQPESAEVLV
jgi:signal transduction histidine kinase